MSRTHSMLGWLIILALLGAGAAGRAADTNRTAPLRLAFSAGAIGGINRSDAKASIIAWVKALMRPRAIVTDVEPIVFDRAEDLFRAMQAGQSDATAVMMNEFATRPAGLEPDAVYLSLKNGKPTEQYVVLVHRASGIGDLGGLKGRSLDLLNSARASLAAPWLDTCLAAQGLGLAETVLGKVERSEKASRVVLRVFFRQADACVVTRDAFETMGELNPQLGKELRVLATSPEVVPNLFFLRPEFTGTLRREIESALVTLHESLAGRQALTVFQGEAMGRYPVSVLQGSSDLLAAAARLRVPAPGGAVEAKPGAAR